jgi:hypothetical protein
MAQAGRDYQTESAILDFPASMLFKPGIRDK